jgi:MYXO-CTERM domain-containing protein
VIDFTATLRSSRLMHPRLLLLMALAAATLTAAQISLDATYTGFRLDNGSPFTGTIAAGWCPCDPISESRSALVFDLPAISGTITAAELRLSLGPDGFTSPQSSETYEIYDVTSPISVITDPISNPTPFVDLGTGTLFGSVTLTPIDEGSLIVIALNPAALQFLNNASGQIAFGGAVSTLAKSGRINEQEIVFRNPSGDNLRQLVLTVQPSAVPEPSTALLAAAGLFSLLAWRRRNG